MENEAQLRDSIDLSGRQARLIIENAVDYAIVGIDLAGTMTSWNVGAERIMGWSPEETIGQPVDLFFTAEDIEAGIPAAEMGAAVRHGRGIDERWHLKCDGSRFWANGEMLPLRRADGELEGYVKILRDRTEQHHVATALADSEERYRTLYDSIDEGFCLIEVRCDDAARPIDYRFLEVNPAFERQTGLVDAAGSWMRDLVPEHEQHWFDVYAKVALTGESTRFTLPAQALNGRWYEVFAYRVGEPLKRKVAVLFSDVTERRTSETRLKASEEHLRALNATLRGSEGNLRLLLDTIGEGFYAVDRNGVTTTCNAAFLRMMGFASARDVIGRKLHDVIHHTHPDGSHYDRADCPIYIAARDGVAAHVGEEQFFPVAGEPLWVEYRATPISQDGEVRGAICTFQDITEQRRGAKARADEAVRRTALLQLGDNLRDVEDTGNIAAAAAYGDVKIVTLSEGEVTQLHVGLKGTMNALFLKDLADKTRRGLRGRVEQGKSGGGNSYGYTVVKQFDAHGEAVRGDRTIDPQQAVVVRRIFNDYAAGKSAKRIAVELNREKVPAPSGGDWGFSTINGNPKRGTGVLNNELYIGKLVWNRQRFVKDPATGKRQARLNPPEEWITQNVPELQIVEDTLWEAVKARQAGLRLREEGAASSEAAQVNTRRRPRYLLSGLTRCGICGGGYAMISTDLLGCSTARNKGTCENRTNIRRDALEVRVLDALRHHLMEPELFAEFCQEFTREMNRMRSAGREALESAETEVKKIDRDLDRLVDMILRGGAADRLNAKMLIMEQRKRELEAFLAEAREPPPLLHPEMASFYRRQVHELHELLQHGPEAARLKAADMLRALISAIVLTPNDEGLEVDVQGDLAGILAIASNAKSPRPNGQGLSQLKVVAGTGFEPVTFRL